jgi:protein TonB
MTYASANRRPNPAALAGALGIPSAVAALLAVGLAVTVTVVPDTPNPQGRDIPTVPLPPPPPDPADPTPRDTATTNTTTVITPTPPVDMSPVDLGQGPVVTTLPGTGDPIGPVDFGTPEPTPTASPFKPVGAVPRGKPGEWVTNADYRPRWIREEMSGSARFTLAIDAGGKVTGCTITRSTGHAALDEATCQLVTKRARFEAARDSTGKPVAGSYSNTVNWQIP